MTAEDSKMSSTTATVSTGSTGPLAPGEQEECAPEARDGISVLWVVFAAVLFAVIVAVLVIPGIRHWVALHTGILHAGPDQYYNFWSGFGSDLGEATLISAVGVGVYTGVRRVNCHTKGCWRIGKHRLDGTPYVLCRHHHPGVPSGGATHAHILEQHRRYQASRDARSS